MAYVFFCSWLMFPVLFIAGPEGLGVITPLTSGIFHLVLDLISKNLWSFLGHFLRVKVSPRRSCTGALCVHAAALRSRMPAPERAGQGSARWTHAPADVARCAACRFTSTS
jgi:bacteriorhodopsin